VTGRRRPRRRGASHVSVAAKESTGAASTSEPRKTTAPTGWKTMTRSARVYHRAVYVAVRYISAAGVPIPSIPAPGVAAPIMPSPIMPIIISIMAMH
jgi:hypothetical protein